MPSRTLSPIVVICGDPGGANALVPVIKHLHSEKKRDVIVFAYVQAIDIMNKNNILFSALDDHITNYDIQGILQRNRPAIIITGTSFNAMDHEKKFIHAAHKLKIPCLAILDFWTNYSLRFSDKQGDLKFVPDKIAIMDEVAYSEMIAEGFQPDTLLVTGQPAFDDLADRKLNFNNERRMKIRDDFQIGANELFVVFVSQPLSMICGENESNPRFLGYTEKTVLKNLVTALNKISQDSKKDIVLIVRPHPREKLDNYEGITSNFIRIIASWDGDPRDIVMASDLVIGMNTELLVEACYLGCIVVSIQPGLRFNDVLPTNHEGYSVPVYSKEKIIETIRMTLMDPDIRSEMKNKLKHFKQDGHATDRIVNTINQMIGTSK
jgi:hypothetical protein